MTEKTKVISTEEVAHVAWLARIELSEEEKQVFTEQLNVILEYFRGIEKVNTEGTPATLHVLDLTDIARDDRVKPSLSQDEVLRNTPRKQAGYVKSPKMV